MTVDKLLYASLRIKTNLSNRSKGPQVDYSANLNKHIVH